VCEAIVFTFHIAVLQSAYHDKCFVFFAIFNYCSLAAFFFLVEPRINMILERFVHIAFPLTCADILSFQGLCCGLAEVTYKVRGVQFPVFDVLFLTFVSEHSLSIDTFNVFSFFAGLSVGMAIDAQSALCWNISLCLMFGGTLF
jgi:hypothetical protein